LNIPYVALRLCMTMLRLQIYKCRAYVINRKIGLFWKFTNLVEHVESSKFNIIFYTLNNYPSNVAPNNRYSFEILPFTIWFVSSVFNSGYFNFNFSICYNVFIKIFIYGNLWINILFFINSSNDYYMNVFFIYYLNYNCSSKIGTMSALI
jgi:hypothetical protein